MSLAVLKTRQGVAYEGNMMLRLPCISPKAFHDCLIYPITNCIRK